jgi:pyrimidine-specific ribonucleoside hydrolase
VVAGILAGGFALAAGMLTALAPATAGAHSGPGVIVDTDMAADDARALALLLTSELHRHLGTYSIVGAKMGLRARERFNVALDELRVESRAGLKPPLSCVNDGLQVATGASLGRGTITVVTNGPPVCEAVFSYGEGRLRLRLKPEFAKQIAADMAELVKRHGGTTPEYFQDVRSVSLRHWLNFDRKTMFEETVEGGQVTP